MAIIKTKYDYSDEIAVINDKEESPEDFLKYKNLRALAKAVAIDVL